MHLTGHELTNLSALWEYLHARLALIMVSSLVLAGWPARPRGELSQGPVPASLSAIPGISANAFNNYADVLFNLRPNSPPMLLIGGTLRQMDYHYVAVRSSLDL